MGTPRQARAISPAELCAIHHLAIVGASARGAWLAQRAAQCGYQVILENLMPAKRRMAAQQLGRDAHAIIFAASVEEAARHADLVVDFVPDELESKLEIFSLLDRMCPPHTIFATPTQILSIADLASCTYRAERCLALRLPLDPESWGEHFSVEVVHAPEASLAVVDTVTGFWTSLGAEVTISVDRAALP